MASSFCDGFVAGICQKVDFLYLCRLFQKLVSGWINKKKTGLRDAHCIVWWNSGEPLRERSVGDKWSGKVVLGCRTISSSIIFALCDILRTLITCINASRVCLLYPLSLLGVTMWPRSCAKSLIVEFAENFYRENRLLGKIFVPGFVILYLTHNYQLLETRCSETAFANQRMASVYF